MEARPDLLGHARPADDAAPFQDERPQPRPRQVRSGNEAVVAGPDHDRVVRACTDHRAPLPWIPKECADAGAL